MNEPECAPGGPRDIPGRRAARPRGIAALLPPIERGPGPRPDQPALAPIVRTLLDSAGMATILLVAACIALAWLRHRNPATGLAGELITFAVARPSGRVALAFPIAAVWLALWAATLGLRHRFSGRARVASELEVAHEA